MQRPEPKLAHMPTHIKQKITDSARNVGTKLALSQVSKEFKSLAKDSPITYYTLKIQLQVDKVTVTTGAWFVKPNCQFREELKKLVMEFYVLEDGVLMRNATSDWKKTLPEKDYRKAAVQYLLGIIGPKTTIEKLAFEVESSVSGSSDLDDSEDLGDDLEDPENSDYPFVYPMEKFEEDRKVIMDEMEQGLQAKKHQLLVESLDFSILVTQAHVMQILPYLEPGTLSEIEFAGHTPHGIAPLMEVQLPLDQIAETEQWKKAKSVDLCTYECDIPFEKWCHFTKVDVCLHRPDMTMKALLKMFLSRTDFRGLGVTSNEEFDRTGVREYLTKLEQAPKQVPDEDSDESSDEDSNDGSDSSFTSVSDDDDENRNIEIRMPNEPNTRISAFISDTTIHFTRSELRN